MVGPERGLGQPAVHRVAEDALCLLAHEGELEARHVRFPDDSLDRVDQIPESLLRGYRFGESRALAFQQSLPRSEERRVGIESIGGLAQYRIVKRDALS